MRSLKFSGSCVLYVLLVLAVFFYSEGCSRETSQGGTNVEIYFNVSNKVGYAWVVAEISLDGELVGTAEDGKFIKILVEPGSHEIKVAAPRYESETKKLRVLKTDRQQFHFLLHGQR